VVVVVVVVVVLVVEAAASVAGCGPWVTVGGLYLPSKLRHRKKAYVVLRDLNMNAASAFLPEDGSLTWQLAKRV
jgi:hypothetical protein